MIIKLLTEHFLEILSLKGGCRGSSESTHVKMPQCWKSQALAHFMIKNWLNWTYDNMTDIDLPMSYWYLLLLHKTSSLKYTCLYI